MDLVGPADGAGDLAAPPADWRPPAVDDFAAGDPPLAVDGFGLDLGFGADNGFGSDAIIKPYLIGGLGVFGSVSGLHRGS